MNRFRAYASTRSVLCRNRLRDGTYTETAIVSQDIQTEHVWKTHPSEYHRQNEGSKRGGEGMAEQHNEYVLPYQCPDLPKKHGEQSLTERASRAERWSELLRLIVTAMIHLESRENECLLFPNYAPQICIRTEGMNSLIMLRPSATHTESSSNCQPRAGSRNRWIVHRKASPILANQGEIMPFRPQGSSLARRGAGEMSNFNVRNTLYTIEYSTIEVQKERYSSLHCSG